MADPKTLEVPDTVKDVRDKERQADTVLSAWRKEARTNYDMVAGDGRQWAPEVRAKLEGEGRPCVEFNRTGAIVDAVSGSEINNRQEVTFIPRVLGDVQKTGITNLRTAGTRWARDNCDAEDEESDSFVDVLITGMGFTQTRMDYEEEEEGKIVIERVDPLEMSWDPAAKKRNLADARWMSRKKKYTKDEIESKWPDKIELLQNLPQWSDDDDADPDPKVVDPQTFYDGATPGTLQRGLHDVTHHQWYEVVKIHKVLDPMTGQIVEMDEERFAINQQINPNAQNAVVPRRIYKQAFICGDVELEVSEGPCKNNFTFQAITGKRDRNKGYWYGLVRPMRDPQMWANKFFSQILHIINTNAKGGVMFETGAITNPRKFEQRWAKADSAIELNPGGINKIKDKPVVQVPAALGQMMEFAISSIRDCPGVNLELLGMADRQQAGVLEDQRTRAGLTILAPFFGSLRHYRKRQGRLLAYFVNEYISDGRLIKVAGPEGEQFVRLMKESGDIEYETVVDDAPTARDTKEKTWMALGPIMQMFVQNGVMIPVEALDYAPIPATLASAFKQAYMQHIQQVQQPNPMQGAELANKNADTELKEAGAAEKYFKAGQAGITALQMLMGPQPPAPGVPPSNAPAPAPNTVQ